MEKVAGQAKHNQKRLKNTLKNVDNILKNVYTIIIKGKQNSEGRREYRKGKQECHIAPGNRIREIEKSRIVTRCLKPAGAGGTFERAKKGRYRV